MECKLDAKLLPTPNIVLCQTQSNSYESCG